MITVWGEGRGFRVAWLLEELELPYTLRPVDLLQDIRNDPEFLAINPGGFIPALQDGDTVMVESVAIMQYLLARHGPSPLAPEPHDPGFSDYLQFLLMGEAGLAGPSNAITVSHFLAPEEERGVYLERWAVETFRSRLGLVTRQLGRAPYMAGDRFTAADISVTYGLEHGQRNGLDLGEPARAYVARTTARPAYARAMDSCADTKAWVASLAASAAAEGPMAS